MRVLAPAIVVACVLASCVTSSGSVACDSYCTEVLKECTGADSPYSGATESDRLSACRLMCAKLPGGSEEVGDTVTCRGQAVTLAKEARQADAADQARHHASCLDSGPFSERCGGLGRNFCRLALQICGTSPFATQAACETAFAGVPAGTDKGIDDAGTVGANTKLCRFYHLEKAAEAPAAHCPHVAVPSTICTM